MSSAAPLSELNKKSSTIGEWTLIVHRGTYTDYTYQWGGKDVATSKFECTLVSQDGTQYCLGSAKKKKGDVQELKNLQATFKNGTVWKFSKVQLVDMKREYVSASCKVVIDLRASKRTAVLSAPSMPSAPSPSKDISTITQLTGFQQCDFMGIVKAFGVVRENMTTSLGARDIVDISVVDGSSDAAGVSQLDFAMFFPSTESGRDELAQLRSSFDDKKPVAFFNMTCRPEEGKVVVKCGRDFYWMVASGAKAERLAAEAATLFALDGDAVQVVTKSWEPSYAARDFLAEEATHTNCALLASVLEQTGWNISTSLVQINHAYVHLPGPGSSITTNCGSRLWFAVSIADSHYSGLNVYIREKAALQLARLPPDAKDQFVTQHEAGDLSFPVFSSLRIKLEPGESGMSAVVVEAEEQDMHKMPTAAALEWDSLMKLLASPGDVFLPTTFAQIKDSPHAGMVVGESNLPCSAVLVLAAATEKSGFSAFGEGFRLTTNNVVDVGFGNEEEKLPLVNLVSICTPANMTDFKLDPPRTGSKQQFALVVVSGVITSGDQGLKTFMVERVQLLPETDVPVCKTMLAKLAYLSKQLKFEGSRAAKVRWDSEATTPLAAKKARMLSYSPSDASVPGTD